MPVQTLSPDLRSLSVQHGPVLTAHGWPGSSPGLLLLPEGTLREPWLRSCRRARQVPRAAPSVSLVLQLLLCLPHAASLFPRRQGPPGHAWRASTEPGHCSRGNSRSTTGRHFSSKLRMTMWSFTEFEPLPIFLSRIGTFLFFNILLCLHSVLFASFDVGQTQPPVLALCSVGSPAAGPAVVSSSCPGVAQLWSPLLHPLLQCLPASWLQRHFLDLRSKTMKPFSSQMTQTHKQLK